MRLIAELKCGVERRIRSHCLSEPKILNSFTSRVKVGLHLFHVWALNGPQRHVPSGIGRNFKRPSRNAFMKPVSSIGGNERVPYVFVRLKSATKKSVVSKRVLIPENLAQLRKVCQAALKPKDPITVFSTCDDEIIQNISDVQHGTTIYASCEQTKDPEADFERLDQVTHPEKPAFDPHAPIQLTHFPKKSKPGNAVAPNYLVIGFPSDILRDQSNQQDFRRKPAKKKTPKLFTPPVFPEEEEDDQQEVAAQPSFFFDQSNIPVEQSDDDSSVVIATGGLRPKRLDDQETLTALQEKSKTLVGGLFKHSPIMGKLRSGLRGVPEGARQFFGEADNGEFMQRTAWKTSVSSKMFTAPPPEVYLLEDIRDAAQRSVISHRCVLGDQATHHFNTGIVGPRKSGKSTLLHVYMEQVMIDLLACGDWKRTFLFSVDMKALMPLANDFAVFYRQFIELLCE
jgi:hypothetical protein